MGLQRVMIKKKKKNRREWGRLWGERVGGKRDGEYVFRDAVLVTSYYCGYRLHPLIQTLPFSICKRFAEENREKYFSLWLSFPPRQNPLKRIGFDEWRVCLREGENEEVSVGEQKDLAKEKDRHIMP